MKRFIAVIVCLFLFGCSGELTSSTPKTSDRYLTIEELNGTFLMLYNDEVVQGNSILVNIDIEKKTASMESVVLATMKERKLFREFVVVPANKQSEGPWLKISKPDGTPDVLIHGMRSAESHPMTVREFRPYKFTINKDNTSDSIIVSDPMGNKRNELFRVEPK